MGGSESKPLFNVRAKHGKLEALLIKGQDVLVFDTSKSTEAHIVELGAVGGKDCSGLEGSDFTKDGKFYATFSSYEEAIDIIDTKTGETVKQLGKKLPEKLEMCDQVLFSPDEKFVYFICKDVTGLIEGYKQILVFEVESGELKNKIEGHNAVINSMAKSRCGKFLATGDADNQIILWDLTSSVTSPKMLGSPIKPPKHDSTAKITSLTFSGDSNFLYCVVHNHATARLDPRTFGFSVTDADHKQVFKMGGDTEADIEAKNKVYKLTTSGCGKMLVGAMEEKFVRVYIINQDGSLTKKFDIENLSGNTMEVSCSCDNKLAVCCRDNSIWLYDLNTGKGLMKDFGKGVNIHQYQPVFSPDGTLLAQPNQQCGNMLFSAIMTGEEKGFLRKAKNDKIAYQSIAFNEDGTKIILTGGEKGEEKETLDVENK